MLRSAVLVNRLIAQHLERMSHASLTFVAFLAGRSIECCWTGHAQHLVCFAIWHTCPSILTLVTEQMSSWSLEIDLIQQTPRVSGCRTTASLYDHAGHTGASRRLPYPAEASCTHCCCTAESWRNSRLLDLHCAHLTDFINQQPAAHSCSSLTYI